MTLFNSKEEHKYISVSSPRLLRSSPLTRITSKFARMLCSGLRKSKQARNVPFTPARRRGIRRSTSAKLHVFHIIISLPMWQPSQAKRHENTLICLCHFLKREAHSLLTSRLLFQQSMLCSIGAFEDEEARPAGEICGQERERAVIYIAFETSEGWHISPLVTLYHGRALL